jgi:hypothetical protein
VLRRLDFLIIRMLHQENVGRYHTILRRLWLYETGELMELTAQEQRARRFGVIVTITVPTVFDGDLFSTTFGTRVPLFSLEHPEYLIIKPHLYWQIDIAETLKKCVKYDCLELLREALQHIHKEQDIAAALKVAAKLGKVTACDILLETKISEMHYERALRSAVKHRNYDMVQKLLMYTTDISRSLQLKGFTLTHSSRT